MSDVVEQEMNGDGIGGEALAGAVADRPAVKFRFSSEVVVLGDRARGAAAESIHALRTHLIAKHIREGRRGLAVCSPENQADSVFVAVNLAISLSQAGIRTLLIDSDLREPIVPEFVMSSSEVTSLHDLLTDERLMVSEAIWDVMPDLSIIFSGGRSADAPELLATPRFKQLADLCLRNYDVTIVTTSPTAGCADARRVASVLRYAMVVARKDVTFVSDVKTLVNELTGDGVRVIGTVMNAF